MEKVLLVIVKIKKYEYGSWGIEEKKQELIQLTQTCKAKIVSIITQTKEIPNSAYFVGRGKVEEISQIVQQEKVDAVIFDHELTNAQQKNLEKIINIKTVDRTQLILDIFAQHAKSKEGKIQVELAQLNYLLPKLVGKGIALSRLGAGIGTRGPGEQKLEVDRRKIRKRIFKLKEELKNLERRRESLRIRRKANRLPIIALVGYTNAGKTTLLNALTGSHQSVENHLFSTLDPVIRRFILSGINKTVLFADTVGFLHKLPHHLIEAFKATLEEITQADILLHILDIFHPQAEQQADAVHEVLKELGASDKPIITCLNKIDKINNIQVINRFERKFPETISISAMKKQGLSELIIKISNFLSLLLTVEFFLL